MARLPTQLLLLALAAAPAAATAAPVQERGEIREAARAFLASQASEVAEEVEIQVDRLDPRLRLTACGQPLQSYFPPGAQPKGRTTVGVRCPGPKPWKLFVPARVEVYGAVLVAARPLPRGTVVNAGDVRLERRKLSRQAHGYFTAPKQAAGKRTQRRINPGAVLRPAALQARRLVRRGQRVTLVTRGKGLQVSMHGEALADGASGERIRVRNSHSDRVVEGTVIGKGRIRVGSGL